MDYISAQDTDTHRICGTCGESLPVDEFYKDGKDSDGNVKRRRDCKQCYKGARIQDAINKMK